jgi:hypothetical protein
MVTGEAVSSSLLLTSRHLHNQEGMPMRFPVAGSLRPIRPTDQPRRVAGTARSQWGIGGCRAGPEIVGLGAWGVAEAVGP